MKSKHLLILALALSLPSGALLAQNDGPPDGPPPGSTNDVPGGPGGGGPGRRRPPPQPIVTALDTNHDGIISADEIANAPAALKTLDKNGDGQLTKDEYLPQRPKRPNSDGDQNGPPPDGNGQGGPKRPVPPIITALDTNGDGVISADEIANAAKSLLKLDKNGDGQLTRDEYMGPRPPRREGGQDGPDGQGPPPDGDGQYGPGPGNGQRPPPRDQNN